MILCSLSMVGRRRCQLAEPGTIDDWDAGLVGYGVDDIPASAEIIAGRASLIDGDAIEIHGIRILNMDAPESRQVQV